MRCLRLRTCQGQRRPSGQASVGHMSGLTQAECRRCELSIKKRYRKVFQAAIMNSVRSKLTFLSRAEGVE